MVCLIYAKMKAAFSIDGMPIVCGEATAKLEIKGV
jgi:hypothetical protein